ncbi:MAG: Crp/Fnr family transcriptional regulator [Anaerolineae bacterium]|nr:Crp/Fnr family transcriptional regulator [Anaerolineae bacterium]
MSYAHVLRNVSLFAQFNDTELELLATNLSTQGFHRNQVLFQQGSTTSSLYVVKTGQIEVTAFGRDNEVTYTGIYGPDQCFGEFSLLDGLPRSGKAVALVNSDLLVLTRPIFFRFLEQHSTVALKLLVTVSRRMRFAESAVDHPRPLGADRAVIHTLITIAEHYSSPEGTIVRLNLHLTGDDLASLSGVTRNTAYALVDRFCAQRLLAMERSHITCVDLARLRQLLAAEAAAPQAPG